jgi:hypothetical protein
MMPLARQWPTFDVTARTRRLSGSIASAKNRSSSIHQSRLNRVLRSAALFQKALASPRSPSIQAIAPINCCATYQ